MKSSLLTVAFLGMMIAFTSCGSDDESSVDELLSTATTQVEFQLPNDRRTYIMYDCAGNHLVGTYTAAGGKKCTLSLRQGKHHIVWFKDFNNESVKYEPEGDALIALSEDGMTDDPVYYEEIDLEVSPYAVETQSVGCYKEATCRLYIIPTDVTNNLALPDGYNKMLIGKVTGLPLVRTVSLSDSNYKTNGNVELNVKTSYSPYDVNSSPNSDGVYVHIDGCQMLCPKDGLKDIQLNVEIKDANGKVIKTTQLPRFSLIRRYSIILQGPLFSGSPSDWKVWKEENDD